MEKVRLLMILALAAVLHGCGSVKHRLDLSEGYAPPQEARVAIGQIRNQSGKDFGEIDPVGLLRDSLAEALRKENLLWSGSGPKITIDADIIEYEPGSAFKRWLLPGWGSTVLTVRAALRDGERIVGTAESRRTISIGGGYSIGAWRTIFSDVAEDLAGDLKAKIRGDV